jgi:hypothetical protein
MATTKSITSDDTIWITTFFGGRDRGRCFTVTAIRGGFKSVKTFDEEAFIATLFANGSDELAPDDGVRPEFDR